VNRPNALRVAVLVDTATNWGRQLIRGILSDSGTHGRWRLWLQPHGQAESLRLPAGWTGDGVIARISTEAMATRLASLRVPVVNVSAIEIRGAGFPRVTTDLHASARLAVEHFLDRGLRHFGYFGLPDLDYVARHYGAFTAILEEAGYPCSVFLRGRGTQPSGPGRRRRTNLREWLRERPKPVGIFTWSLEGLAVLDACHAAGLHVPEEVAILNGVEDELICPAVHPPLSGIAGPSEQIGREAAALLHRLIQGQAPPDGPILLRPSYVVSRQSTDLLAIDDPELVAAIRFIRAHAAAPIQVESILREVPLSRRTLERKFLDVLGRSPAAEIRRVHLDRARQLLAETRLPIPAVAASSGFGSSEYLAYVFKAETGLTPLQYRSQVRSHSPASDEPAAH